MVFDTKVGISAMSARIWLTLLVATVFLISLSSLKQEVEFHRRICVPKIDEIDAWVDTLKIQLPIFSKERAIDHLLSISVSGASNERILDLSSCDIFLNISSSSDDEYLRPSSDVNTSSMTRARLCPEDQASIIPILDLPLCWLRATRKGELSDQNNKKQLFAFLQRTLCSFPTPHEQSPTEASETTSPVIPILTALETAITLVLKQRYEPTVWEQVFTQSEWTTLTHWRTLEHRQSVSGVVIWIGSGNKINLIRDQTIPLNQVSAENQHVPGVNSTILKTLAGAVIPWAATDILYPCRKGSTKCHGGNGKYKFIPKSDINYMSAGWGCAQRRPLRALAHVLALYDPLYVVILDDDTFFNFPLFLRKYSSFLLDQMSVAPIVLGEFVGRSGDNGHLSRLGMMAGGSGYILGKALLDRLVARELIESVTPEGVISGSDQIKVSSSKTPVAWQDLFRSSEQISYLTIVKETKKLSASHTGVSTPGSKVDSTVLINSTSQLYTALRFAFTYDSAGSEVLVPRMETFYKVQTRLIDHCVQLMAREHTCLHSDHSIARCVLYGAWATPVSVVCHSFVDVHDAGSDSMIDATGRRVRTGMCFSIPFCNTSAHVTCHRYQARRKSAQRGFEAVRVAGYESHNFKFSSGFDGNMTDSY